MGLLSQIGGVAKEAGRNAIISGGLGLLGYSAMSGQVQYPEYEYDANGHIKGVSSKYAAALRSLYNNDAGSIPSGIDGNSGGLGSSVSVKLQGNAPFSTKFDQYSGQVKQSVYDTGIDYDQIRKDANDPKLPIWKQSLAQGILANKASEEKSKNNNKNKNDLLLPVPSLADSMARDYSKKKINEATLLYNDQTIASNVKPIHLINSDPFSDVYKLKLPDWNYADFINERAIWQKGLSSVFDEPGWFYFKIFFNLNTNHGLFGGLLNSKEFTQATNSAAKYLYTNKNHKQIKARDRITALHKFASIISYISNNAPWYFKDVKGLNNAVSTLVDDFSKERSIEIGVTQDAIDMRLSSLMSLYNYACFDNFLGKEIIPENLRKFDMTIIIFQTPLRYLHTSFTSNKKTEFMGIDVGAVVDEVTGLFGKKKKGKAGTKYKSMDLINGDSQNFGDLMSMKIYSFMGCEFDMESFASIIPGQMSNENPFQLGNSSIKIKFTKCIEHTMNEFYGMMWGADGFYFNQYNNFQLSDGLNSYYHKINTGWEKQQERYQALKDTLEDITQGGTILGLIDSPKTYKKAIDATEAVMNGLFDNGGMLKGLLTNAVLGALGSSQTTQAPQGNIYGDVGIGSAYFKDKVEMLKNGIHERTTAPYYYDPDTGVRRDLHVDKNYSALDYNKYKSMVSNFSAPNFLQTNTQKYASFANDWLREQGDKLLGQSSDFTQQPYRPNQYNINTAQDKDSKRFEGIGKNHDMVDGSPNNRKWQYTQKPYSSKLAELKDILNDKSITLGKNRSLNKSLTGDHEHQFTQSPIKYNLIDYINK